MARWAWQARDSKQVTGDRAWPVTDQKREAQPRRTWEEKMEGFGGPKSQGSNKAKKTGKRSPF